MTIPFIGPPVRPRYRIVSLTGYTTMTDSRKPRTTWAVHDRLYNGNQVGPDYFTEGKAERMCALLEDEWERHLGLTDEGRRTPAPEELPKPIRRPRAKNPYRRQPFRPVCPRCRRRATVGGQQHCPGCGANYYFANGGPYAP